MPPPPRSVRLDAELDRRLRSWTARHRVSASAAVARLVDEGLRMEEFPGVVFADGPAGRRARLTGGPDVWEVVRAVRSARAAEPGLDEQELLDLVHEDTGVPRRQLRLAVAYWATHPTEVDAFVEHADRAEADGVAAAQRERGLLAGRLAGPTG